MRGRNRALLQARAPFPCLGRSRASHQVLTAHTAFLSCSWLLPIFIKSFAFFCWVSSSSGILDADPLCLHRAGVLPYRGHGLTSPHLLSILHVNTVRLTHLMVHDRQLSYLKTFFLPQGHKDICLCLRSLGVFFFSSLISLELSFGQGVGMCPAVAFRRAQTMTQHQAGKPSPPTDLRRLFPCSGGGVRLLPLCSPSWLTLSLLGPVANRVASETCQVLAAAEADCRTLSSSFWRFQLLCLPGIWVRISCINIPVRIFVESHRLHR